MKIIRHKQHQWIEKDGKIDDFGFNVEFCNGPACKSCGYFFCVHCNPDGYDNTECIRYECEKCGCEVREKAENCPRCGNELAKELIEVNVD